MITPNAWLILCRIYMELSLITYLIAFKGEMLPSSGFFGLAIQSLVTSECWIYPSIVTMSKIVF
jgi:hypothetical protein